MPSVSFEPEAFDHFIEILKILCRDTLAVTLVPESGKPFGAVLIGCDRETLMYEVWDEPTRSPNREPNTFAITEISEVQVF